MLKEILSITGKPGLFKMVSQGRNMLIVESLSDGKRIPVHSKDKVVSLGDIAIYTDEEEVPLAQVLEALKNKENAQKASIDAKADNDKLRNFMAEVLPSYDRDRVYLSDIRKLINWYNLLIAAGITEYKTTEATTENASEEEKTVEA